MHACKVGSSHTCSHMHTSQVCTYTDMLSCIHPSHVRHTSITCKVGSSHTYSHMHTSRVCTYTHIPSYIYPSHARYPVHINIHIHSLMQDREFTNMITSLHTCTLKT
eukprot:c18423_g1_i3 orf=59-379(-)